VKIDKSEFLNSMNEIRSELLLDDQVKALGRDLVDSLSNIKFLLNLREFVVIILIRKSGKTTFETISAVLDFSVITNESNEIMLKDILQIEIITGSE